MEIDFDLEAMKDLEYWKKSGNDVLKSRIQNLLLNIAETPYKGIGKPEALKYNLSGKWSRRIILSIDSFTA
ncbi:MAG: Txe/YoeB family addiction module toxin [Ginsengibacter sp.]|jgi:toxin YoeB